MLSELSSTQAFIPITQPKLSIKSITHKFKICSDLSIYFQQRQISLTKFKLRENEVVALQHCKVLSKGKESLHENNSLGVNKGDSFG